MHKSSLIPVWDPVVRLFHWLLVAAFATSWLTQEEQYDLHLLAGYTTLGLVCMRLLWGFIGTRYARFTDFVYSPATIYAYLKSITHGCSKRYIGHNPAAGVMILALLTGLLTVIISGIALDAAENWSGPMSEMNLYHYTGQIQFIHTLSSNLLLILILSHLLGVIYTSLAQKENLIRAMITGRKREH
jgi:cytochrome b